MKHTINSMKDILKNYNLIQIGKNKKSIIFLFLCLILGVILGSIAVSSFSMDCVYKFNSLFLNDFKQKISESNIEIFISSFSTLSLFAIALEISAISCLGILLIPLIVVFRGFSLGMAAGYLYLIHGLKGIAFYLLILLPGIFVSAVGLTLFAAICMKFSFKLIKIILYKEKNEGISEYLKKHLQKSGYCIIVLALSAGIDVCFMIMFSKFFSF